MDAANPYSQSNWPSLGNLLPQDVESLLAALGQWGVAEEAGIKGDALNEYAARARSAFERVAHAA